MPSRLDVIIVSYNTRADTLACLASLVAPPPRDLGAILVVDNASSDGTVDAVRGAWPRVEVVALERNGGFAAANNAGFARTTAPLVLLLNSDTIVPPGAIDALADRLEATGAVAAGPRLVNEAGRPEVSFGRMLTPAAEAAQLLRGRLARSSAAWARRRTDQHVSEERDVDWVSGACLLVRRDAAHAAGFFDERFFLYEEDVDFCAALRARGGRVLFTPHATIVHRGGRSGAPRSGQYDRSHVLFYDKHAPHWAPWLRAWLRVRGRAVR
jgi:N-acetylglucosaminyl-diphospho-decaprenol L-rhamnosyltransferase